MHGAATLMLTFENRYQVLEPAGLVFDLSIFILKTKSGCHHDLKTPTLNLKLIIDDNWVEFFLLVFVCLFVHSCIG